MADKALLDDEAQLGLTPYERRPRREPQTYQELSPQLDFLYRAVDSFAQWVQFADAKAGGVILVLSIGALDVFHKARDYIDAHKLAHPYWGWIALVGFVAAAGAMAFTIAGVGRTLFPKLRESKPSDYFFGVAATYSDGESYGGATKARREVEILDQVAIQAWNLGCIASDKYRFLRYAYIGAFCFVVTWAVARVSLSLAS